MRQLKFNWNSKYIIRQRRNFIKLIFIYYYYGQYNFEDYIIIIIIEMNEDENYERLRKNIELILFVFV